MAPWLATASELTGTTFEHVFGAANSDAAAKGVSHELGLEEKIYGMHSGDKFGQSATGALVRTKSKKVCNPFPEGVQLCKEAHAMGVHFTHGSK